jgi:hypothetical protein
MFPDFILKTLDIACMFCWLSRLPEGEYLARAKEVVGRYVPWDDFISWRSLPDAELEDRVIGLVLG